MKNSVLCARGLAILLAVCLALVNFGCSKDDSPAAPSGGVNYGSGTVTVTSSVGNLNISGTGVWPVQAGPSVIAMYDTSVHLLMVYGYQRISGPNYNIAALGAFIQTRVDTGTYHLDTVHTQSLFAAAYNVDTTLRADSLVYRGISGSVRVSSVSGSNAAGTYSVMAKKGAGQLIQFTGTFNVTYAVGVLPDWRRAVLRSRPWPTVY